jgi:alanyl-tRNA synthetase
MTEKLFWIDPYQKEFSATVVDQFPVSDGHAVVLDRTCFYATSGGQPNDLGTLNFLSVKDVRFQEDRLIHVLSDALSDSSVEGRVDWNRRFDHMQQHTGQHILSAAFFRMFQAETSSFHLGDEYCSIELSRPDLSPEDVRNAENLANSIIFGAGTIETFLVDPEKASDYPLRKKSDLQESLRIVKIGEFDLSPCSGTHVRNSGEVGMLFITALERLSQTLKISFLCGQRVAKQYHGDLAILKQLSKQMTTSIENLPESITKLQDQFQSMRKELTQWKEERWKQEANELYRSAAEEGKELRRIVKTWKRPYSEVRFIAQRLLELPEAIGVLVSIPDKRAVFFKHPKSAFNLRPAFDQFLKTHSAKGGGPPHLMEAGGFELSHDFDWQLQKLLEERS